MNRHLHIHFRDYGTSEGARKAAQSRGHRVGPAGGEHRLQARMVRGLKGEPSYLVKHKSSFVGHIKTEGTEFHGTHRKTGAKFRGPSVGHVLQQMQAHHDQHT